MLVLLDTVVVAFTVQPLLMDAKLFPRLQAVSTLHAKEALHVVYLGVCVVDSIIPAAMEIN